MKTLGEVLLDISSQSSLRFKRVNDNIFVRKEKKNKKVSFISEIIDIKVEGTVRDETGEPLPGATVIIKGTSKGTTTDFEGKYSLSVAEDAVLLISFVGYTVMEVPVNNRSVIDISLEPDSDQLDEVVVIGYGARKRSEITGAVATVNKNYIAQQPGGRVDRALQGSVAGVSVTNQGTPGGNSRIRIRGIGTINNNDPLWIVDGVFGAPAPPGNQIESIQVLKDAASTAIYGTRGANGVILVTTKSGKKSQPLQIEITSRVGFVTPKAKHDIIIDPLLTGEMRFLEDRNDDIVNDRAIEVNDPHFGSGENPVVPDFLLPNGGFDGDAGTSLADYDQFSNPITRVNPNGTDWLDETYQKGVIQDYNLAIVGGSEKTNYSFHVNYYEEEGQLIHTSYDRIGLRSNTDSKLNKWLTIGQRTSFNRARNHGYNSNNQTEGFFKDVYEVSTLLPKYDIAGNFAGNRVGGRVGAIETPFAFLTRQQRNQGNNNQLVGNAYATITPIKGLDVKTLYGYDLRLGRSYNPQLKEPEHSTGRTETALNENSFTDIRWNFANTINYKKKIGASHEVEILVGMEAYKRSFRNVNVTKSGFAFEDPNYLVLNAAPEIVSAGGGRNENTLYSLFGRLHYGYKSKYLVDFTMRRDKSSRFGSVDPVGYFPAVSLGWAVSEESFLDGTSSWLDALKIRGSWGQSGNDQTGDYNSFSTYSTNPGRSGYALGGSDNSISAGFQADFLGNEVTTWEITTSSNVGIDATLFGSFGVSIDLWNRFTSDMLVSVPTPDVVGKAGVPSLNVGDMENKGVDITLDYNSGAFNHELTYFASLTYSRYKNEVTKLSGIEGNVILGDNARNQVYTRVETGRSFPEFYGYTVNGIFQTDAEASGWPTNEVQEGYNRPGSLRIVDINDDGVINDEDRSYIGNPHPDFTMGLNAGAAYKGFDFAMTFYASVGHDIVNYGKRFMDYGLFDGPKSPERLYKSWGSPYLNGNNEAASLPRATATANTAEMQASTVYVEDGSYLRLQNLQIGYSLPSSILNSLNIKKVRLYWMATNLFTMTNYSGLNPEVSDFGNPNQSNANASIEKNRGVDISTWPVAKQFLFGVDLTF
ncbi:MAG: TonB-dependent receptor [Cyclobacteriaceae bacterium]